MRALFFAVAILLTACGGAPAPAPVAAPPPKKAAPLHEGPLPDYVVAAGLRWMLLGRPNELAKKPRVVQLLSGLLPPERIDAYSDATGVDLRNTPNALIAGYDYGTLYMAEVSGPTTSVQDAFVERLLTDPKEKRPHPRIREVTGIVGATPETLVSIENRLVAVAVGDPLPARIVSLFATKKLKKSPPALRGASLSTLDLGDEGALARFYATGPFEGEWGRAARGLLRDATAAAITAEPTEEAIAVTISLAGDWRAVGPDASARLLGAWEDLASNPTGRLLGFDRPRAAPVLGGSAQMLELRVELEGAPIVQGLRAAVVADVWEILSVSPSTSSPPSIPRDAAPTEKAP